LKIHKITLRGWRIFREECSIEFSDNITVIYGPNEAGKSTIIQAAVRALFDRHTARSQEMQAVQPWGSHLAPRVSVEFSAADNRYKVTKQFLNNPLSELHLLKNGKWELIADGDASDRKILEIIGGNIPARGLSSSDHRGIAQALWVFQGDDWLPDKWNEEIADRLEHAVGTTLRVHGSATLEQKIKEKYEERLTPKRGEPRSGSELQIKIQELQQTEEKLKEVVTRRNEYESKLFDLDTALRETLKLEEELEKAEKKLQEAEENFSKAKKHMENRLKAYNYLIEAERKYERLNNAVIEIKTRLNEIEGAKESVLECEAELKALSARISSLDGKLNAISETIKQNNKRKKKLEKQKEAVSILVSICNIKKKIENLMHDLEEARKINCNMKIINEKINSRPYPNEEEVEKASDLYEKIREGEAALKAEGLTLRLRAKEEDVTGTVFLDGTAKSLSLHAGEKRYQEFIAAASVSIDTKYLELEIESGSNEARQALKNLEENRNILNEMLTEFSVNSLKELRELQQEKNELQKQLTEMEKDLKRLEWGGTISKIEAQLIKEESLLQSKQEALSTFPLNEEWKTSAMEVLEEIKESLQKEIDELTAELEELEQKKESSRNELEILKGKQNKTEGTKREKDALIKQWEKDIEELRKKDGFTTDEERKDSLEKAAAEVHIRKLALNALEKEQYEKEEKPEEEYKKSKKNTARLLEQLEKKKQKVHEIKGALDDAGVHNLREQEGNLEAYLNFLKSQCVRLQEEAEAWRLLDNLVTAHRRKQHQALVTPVRDCINMWIKKVAGPDFGEVNLSEEIIPKSVYIQPYGIDVPVNNYSYGALEQLNVLVRLAIGWVISENESHTVILDDRLVHTDPARFDRMSSILNEAAHRLQIIILTCYPGRYSDIADSYINMEDIIT